jgi:hypothetical protein
MKHTHRPALERVSFHDGQLLAARDLRDAQSYEARLLEQHIRGLHATWGIALGYRLLRDPVQRRVLVEPGLAYDACGRSLVLGGVHGLPWPQLAPGAPPIDLVICRRSFEDCAAARFQADPCETTAALRERPDFRWVPAGSGALRLGEDVPLGRFSLDPTGALSPPDPSVRRYVRRPPSRVATGRAQINKSAWKAAPNGVVWTTSVSTAAGGFRAPPVYSVTLLRDPAGALPAPLVSLGLRERDRFDLNLLFFHKLQQPEDTQVIWMGVEPALDAASVGPS